MAISFKGDVLTLPTSDVALNDAYCVVSADGSTRVYKYASAISPSIVWTEYNPIRIIDEPALIKVWEGHGTPTLNTNSVQFDRLTIGCFYLDGTTGDVWAYVPSSTGWIKW